MVAYIITIYLILFYFSTLSERLCPKNGTEYNSECYYFYSNLTGFQDAELSCIQIGGHLASIHDAFVNGLLGQEANKHFKDSTQMDFWIGANSLMFHGNWSWIDGTLMDFTDWNKGELQNISGSNCVALSMTDGYWSAQDCFKNKSFVCSVANNYAPTLPPFINCSLGWTYFQPTRSCYGIDWKLLTNFIGTGKRCESLGAQLPSIHSFEEDYFLRAFTYVTQTGVWIGLYSIDEGKTWIWSDGSTVNYTAWAPGQPSNLTNGFYTIIATGFYNKIISDTWFVMCKKYMG